MGSTRSGLPTPGTASNAFLSRTAAKWRGVHLPSCALSTRRPSRSRTCFARDPRLGPDCWIRCGGEGSPVLRRSIEIRSSRQRGYGAAHAPRLAATWGLRAWSAEGSAVAPVTPTIPREVLPGDGGIDMAANGLIYVSNQVSVTSLYVPERDNCHHRLAKIRLPPRPTAVSSGIDDRTAVGEKRLRASKAHVSDPLRAIRGIDVELWSVNSPYPPAVSGPRRELGWPVRTTGKREPNVRIGEYSSSEQVTRANDSPSRNQEKTPPRAHPASGQIARRGWPGRLGPRPRGCRRHCLGQGCATSSQPDSTQDQPPAADQRHPAPQPPTCSPMTRKYSSGLLLVKGQATHCRNGLLACAGRTTQLAPPLNGTRQPAPPL